MTELDFQEKLKKRAQNEMKDLSDETMVEVALVGLGEIFKNIEELFAKVKTTYWIMDAIEKRQTTKKAKKNVRKSKKTLS